MHEESDLNEKLLVKDFQSEGEDNKNFDMKKIFKKNKKYQNTLEKNIIKNI